MEKKVYISPAMVSVAMNVEHQLMEISNEGKNVKFDSDKSESVSGAATKSSGSWDVWSSDDE